VLDAQEADGYLGNFQAIYRYSRKGRELFNESRIEVALLAYYELTGKPEVLAAVEKAVKLTMSKYTPQNRPFTYMPGDTQYTNLPADRVLLNGHSLMFVDVCEWLHRLTGNPTYLTYATFLYTEYSGSTDIDPYDLKTNALMDISVPFTGHGAHVAEQLRAPLFLAYADGRAPYPVATSNAFQKLKRHIVPSGAMVSCEGVYNLPPVPFQGTEYCATTELEISLASALQKTGAMQYGDMIERLAFNAAQGARLPDGTKIAYVSSSTLPIARDAMDLPAPNNSGGRWQYSPAHDMGGSCCSPNAVKLMPYYVSSMWMKPTDEDGLAALLLGPSQVSTVINGIQVTITEETEYPFSDSITFRITAATPVSFPLHIRIPSWSGAVTVTAPGATVSATADLRILRKEWQTGDSVTVAFEHPVITGVCTNGEITVNRGPLLYAMPWGATTNVLTKTRAGVPEFFEWELIPENPQSKSGFFIEQNSPTSGFEAQAQTDYDPANPWAHPRTVLTGELRTVQTDPDSKLPVTLVPMGSALLRFAAFPPIHAITNTATFDGGAGTDGNWRTKENWAADTVPLFNDSLDINFTSGGTNWIGGGVTVRSLRFTDTVDTPLILRTSTASGTGAETLIFGGAGGAAVNVAAGAAGNITIGASANGGPISLAEDLTINHSGSGNLSFNKRVTGVGDMIKNGSGPLILAPNRAVTNDYTGRTVINAGTVTGTTNFVFEKTVSITVAGGATLTLSATNCIGDQTALILVTNAVLNLNFTGTDTVGGISLNGGSTWLAAGTYTAAALGKSGPGSLTSAGLPVFILTGSVTGGNGTVSPSSVSVLAGGSATFVITPSNYYRIASLTTNGTPVTGSSFNNGSKYTRFVWSNVQAAATLEANFTTQRASDPAHTPYFWLAQHGLTNYSTDVALDIDRDGFTTWQEYIAGTNPTDPASIFKITGKSLTPQGTVIRWASESNKLYTLSRTTNLMSGFATVAGASNLPATPPENVYTNLAPDGAATFYRVGIHE
jgi:autotransporter-associated beta strand protein